MTVDRYLRQSVEAFPEKPALVCGSERFTYKALGDAAGSFAGFLRTNGLRTGERVAVYLGNCPETVIAIFGTAQAGGTVVTINAATPSERVGYILRSCEPRFIVAPGAKLGQITEAEQGHPSPPVHILTGEPGGAASAFGFEDACRAPSLTGGRPVSDEDVAAIVYTSGSTGTPKGATLTHRNFDVVTSAVGGYLGHTSEDIILSFLPLSITYGLLQLLVTFRTGGTLVLERSFGYPFEFINRLKKDKITGFAGVPTVYSIITQLNLAGETFPSLRYITNSAAAIPPNFLRRLREIFSTTKIYLMYGLTECLRTSYLPPEEVMMRPTSIGRGMSCDELWLEDAGGNRLPAGETGEMIVRGPNVMKGYWNDPEATAKALRDEINPVGKVLRTGDLFRMDEEGYFYFVSRIDDMIKSRGLKVSPLEVEEAIYLLGDVMEARVIGIPDAVLGQAIKAEVVLKNGGTLTAEQIKAHCQKHLEEFKIPKTVEFVESLPKTEGGKIKRIT